MGIKPTTSHLWCDALPIELSSLLGARWWGGKYTSNGSLLLALSLGSLNLFFSMRWKDRRAWGWARLVPYLKYYLIHFVAHSHLKMCASVKLCSDSIVSDICMSECCGTAWSLNLQVEGGRRYTWRNINVVATSIGWRACYAMARWISYCALWSQLWLVGDIGEEHCDILSQVVHHFTCIWHLRARRSCGKTVVLLWHPCKIVCQ